MKDLVWLEVPAKNDLANKFYQYMEAAAPAGGTTHSRRVREEYSKIISRNDGFVLLDGRRFASVEELDAALEAQ